MITSIIYIGIFFLVGLFIYNSMAMIPWAICGDIWKFSILWCIHQIIENSNISRHFSPNVQTITFDQFYNLYSIKPEHWNLYHNYVVYDSTSFKSSCYATLEFKTYRDLNRYYRFKEELETKENNKKLTEKREKLIKHWQSDIEQYREQTIQEASNSLKAIEAERLKAIERFNNRGEVV